MHMLLLMTFMLAQAAKAPAAKTPAAAATPAAAGAALQVQVALDRAGFSPGVIDGRTGMNTKKALAVLQKQGSQPDASVQPTVKYRITATDAAGPFEAIPEDMMDKSKLTALG